MELVSCTDYVFELADEHLFETKQVNYKSFVDKIIKYASFLKRPLTFGIFIPTDKEGNVLEKPKEPKNELGNSLSWICYNKELNKYQEALDIVLFEGITYLNRGVYFKNELIGVYPNQFGVFSHLRYETIEDLTDLGLTLTNNAVKQLN